MEEKVKKVKEIYFTVSQENKKYKFLKNIFAAPLFLKEFIKEKKPSIRNKIEAQAFLLSNKKYLDPYLLDRREGSTGFLCDLLQNWAHEIPEQIIIDFDAECTISREQKFYLPGIGLIQIEEKPQLQVLLVRYGYNRRFRLLMDGNILKIQVEFYEKISRKGFQSIVKRESKGNPSPPTVCPSVKTKKIKTAHITFAKWMAHFKSKTDSTLSSHLYATPSFEKIEGYSVRGGLPSLGKRR